MILDTDILIAMVSPRRPERLVQKIAGALGPLYTTAVNWAEICHGIARTPQPRARQVREQYTALLPGLTILDFDRLAAEEFGRLRATLAQAGQPLDNMDLMIASIALRHDMTMVTGNTRHFARVPGLRTENWLTEEAQPSRRPSQ